MALDSRLINRSLAIVAVFFFQSPRGGRPMKKLARRTGLALWFTLVFGIVNQTQAQTAQDIDLGCAIAAGVQTTQVTR